MISTRTRVPAKPIFFEGFLNKYDALRREGYFKTTAGKRTLKLMLREYYAEKQLTMPQRKRWGFVFSSQKNNVSRRSGRRCELGVAELQRGGRGRRADELQQGRHGPGRQAADSRLDLSVRDPGATVILAHEQADHQIGLTAGELPHRSAASRESARLPALESSLAQKFQLLSKLG